MQTLKEMRETSKLLDEAREVISQMLKLDRENGDELAARFLAKLRALRATKEPIMAQYSPRRL